MRTPTLLRLTLSLTLAVSAFAGTLTLTNRSYRFRAKGGELIGFYPALEDPANIPAAEMFNRRMHEFLTTQRHELSTATKQNWLTLRVNYETAVTASGIVSVRFETLAEERQMAHPSHLYVAIVMDTVHLRELELKDLFRPGSPWVEELVRLTRADLAGRNLPTTDEWIEKGTGPNPGNFAVFRLTDKTLDIFFPQYQVAPYSAGLQRVSIPLTELSAVLDPRFLH